MGCVGREYFFVKPDLAPLHGMEFPVQGRCTIHVQAGAFGLTGPISLSFGQLARRRE